MPMKTNGDLPAAPLLLDTKPTLSGGTTADDYFEGLTKREMFCLHMGVAETGDAELDAIICKGNRQKIAMQICNGFISGDFDIASHKYRFTELAIESVATADALLAELERNNE